MNGAASAPPSASGLSEAEARERLQRAGPNALPANRPRSLWAIARGVLVEPMFLMLLFAGAVYLALGERTDAVFLMASVLVIIGITLVQERKTQRALEALRDLSAPLARVIRDGREQRVPSTEVVRDDVLVLREGDRIAADAVMLDGLLEADESLLTGESVPVAKRPSGNGAEVFAGTLVTRGRGTARVVGIATDTAVGRIGQALASTVETTSTLQRASRTLIRRFGLAALLCAVGLVLLNWLWDSHGLLDSLLAGVALAIAILPEEFPVILTVFLALGAWRIARHKVLTRRIAAVETLGAITVLAADKTGTLTQNRMAVAELCVGNEVFLPGGASLPPAFHELARLALLATPAGSADPMEHAIRAFGAEHLGERDLALSDSAVREYALTPGLLAMSRAAPLPDGYFVIGAKGAPEAVTELCGLDPAEQWLWDRRVHAMAARGLRVLAVATADWHGPSWPATQRGFRFRFAGLLGLIDPPRDGARAAVAECHAAGIRVLMMTGDHEVTARAIAEQVGLSAAPRVISGAEVDALGDEQLAARLADVDVCARVQPTQKLRLVHALQQRGEVVGMTGDGVNDAPALKAADAGVAMGGRGTDVAREAAALVLLDDDFASLVAAIRQGRRIYDNIVKATRFVVAVHVPVVVLALLPSLLHWPILLMPVQIVLLELLIDPACSIVFEAAPASPRVMRRPPRPIGESPFRMVNLGYGIAQGTGLAAILAACYGVVLIVGDSAELARGATFLGLVAAVLLLTLANHQPGLPLWRIAWRENPWLLRMLGAGILLLAALAGIAPLREAIGLSQPGGEALALLLPLVLACAAWLESVRRVLCRRWPSLAES
ncbi:cation-translocating P-type ATPase [Rhodanobacter aciditrophus]|uniref:cation-translocating P-type ATPase n=1 Tax=Rhodanobacter aciditrophus TaxID=1623218 RepID=UPI003CF663C4